MTRRGPAGCEHLRRDVLALRPGHVRQLGAPAPKIRLQDGVGVLGHGGGGAPQPPPAVPQHLVDRREIMYELPVAPP